MFDEFKEIEWRARVEAIREKLDQQRELRQEQERRADREAEEQAEEQEAEQAGVFAIRIEKMAINLQWQGDRLLPGEPCDSHLLEFRNVIELEGTGVYRYPNDFANPALRNAVDERAGSRATKLLMLSLDRDLAADLQGKNGADANDDSQLQVQPFATPDDAPVVYARFAAATLPQLEDVLRRMSTVSETVDTLITTFEGQVYEPGDDLAVWFSQRERDYRRFRNSMSVREFAAALAKLLPDDTLHAKKVLSMNRPPASLREVMEDTGGRTLAVLKKELVEGRVALEKAAKKCGIRGQVWWSTQGEKKGGRSREVNAVQEEESPAIAAIMKSMEAMQVTVAALAAAQAGGGEVNAVETEKPQTELEKLKAENERLRAAQGNSGDNNGSWEQRYRPKGKGNKGGKGKGPAQGCFTCGGPHYQNQCPQWQGKGALGWQRWWLRRRLRQGLRPGWRRLRWQGWLWRLWWLWRVWGPAGAAAAAAAAARPQPKQPKPGHHAGQQRGAGAAAEW